MKTVNNETSTGEGLKEILQGNKRRKMIYNEETGDFEMVPYDAEIDENSQDVTAFAEEGFA